MEINKDFFKDTFGWGFLLWVFGYILGIIFYMVAPPSMIGWVITPIATVITLWILVKKIKINSPQYYLVIGIIWTVLAIVLDYFLIIKLFKPQDSYYKLDVYLYYALTLILPPIVGLMKQN